MCLDLVVAPGSLVPYQLQCALSTPYPVTRFQSPWLHGRYCDSVRTPVTGITACALKMAVCLIASPLSS